MLKNEYRPKVVTRECRNSSSGVSGDCHGVRSEADTLWPSEDQSSHVMAADLEDEVFPCLGFFDAVTLLTARRSSEAPTSGIFRLDAASHSTTYSDLLTKASGHPMSNGK